MTDSFALVSIDRSSLEASFPLDIVNFTAHQEQFRKHNLYTDDFVEKLTMSIEKTHCESFLVFETDICSFIDAFIYSCHYSAWRSLRNRFVFAYEIDQLEKICWEHKFFNDFSSMLMVEGSRSSPELFELKTNKYIGPRCQNPKTLYTLDRFNASSLRFDYGADLFPDKTQNLMGREVVMSGFEYSPSVILKYDTVLRNVRDVAYENPEEDAAFANIDGIEIKMLFTFCELYNCTFEIDTSEADDWGEFFENRTGVGNLGMVIKDKTDLALSSQYPWLAIYLYLDISFYVARSGITCLVPAPKRLVTWFLPLQPFEPTLWLAVLICLFVETLSLCFLHEVQEKLIAEPKGWWESFTFGYVNALKIFISQSIYGSVQSVSLRTMFIAILMNDIIVSSIYGGGLASILTVPNFEEAADTLDRLSTHQLQWAANSPAWINGINGSDDPRLASVLKNFNAYSDEELAVMALTENIGFAVERLTFGHYAVADYYTSDVMRRLKIMLDDIFFQYTIAVTKRCWPMLPRFNNLLHMWHSSGFDMFWEWRVVSENLNDHVQKQVAASALANYEDTGPEKLGMSNFSGLLLIWVLGITLSISVFIGELVHFRFQQKKIVKVKPSEILKISIYRAGLYQDN